MASRLERRPPPRPTPYGPGEGLPFPLLAGSVLCIVAAGLVWLNPSGGLNHSGISFYNHTRYVTGPLLVVVGVGLFSRRYWAAVTFEALLALQLLVATLSLVFDANSLTAVAVNLVLLAVGGFLFYRMVKVMGRLQATRLAKEGKLPAQEAEAETAVEADGGR